MPRAQLDREKLVQAAARLVNADGWEALSMARLAERLKVQTPSLYNHIDGMPALLRELRLQSYRDLGAAMAEAAISRSGGAAVHSIAQAYRSYVRENIGVYLVSLRSAAKLEKEDIELAEAQRRITRVGLAVMGSLGLDGSDAVHALRGLRSLVHGFAVLEAAGGFGLPEDCDESFRRMLEIFVRGIKA